MTADTAERMAPPEPRANPDLIGHEAAEMRLLESWRSGRLPHAWLITGREGIGKATLAYRFARFVLAGGAAEASLFGAEEGGDGLFVAPESPVFRRVAARGHSDLMTLQRSYDEANRRMRSVITVDEVRGAVQFLGLTAGEGGWRVLVVDSADDFNANAANALLKTLEEPSRNSLILIVCHASGALPATIRSRCCRLSLAPLDDAAVLALLERYAPDLDAGEAAALAQLGDGSIGRALRLADAGGLDLFRTLLGLLSGLPALDYATLHRLADRLGRRGADEAYHAATDLLGWWLGRFAATTARRHDFEAGEIVSGERACARHLAALAGLDRWSEVWEKIGSLVDRADRINLDRGQVVLNAFHELRRAAAG